MPLLTSLQVDDVARDGVIDLRGSTSAAVSPDRRRRPDGARVERVVVASGAFVLYLWTGWILVVDRFGIAGDAFSRVSAASGVIFSRDPHLEALGFVWTPLPALFEVPLVALGRWWPVLLHRGFAAVLVSSTFMALAVAVLRRWLGELGVGRVSRLALVACFAISPLIWASAINGMSEAVMIGFLMVGARRVALWWERDRAIDLMTAGVAFAFAYLARYEAALAGVAVTAAVAVVYHRRALGDGRQRLRASSLRALVVGLPTAFAVVAWAFVSWVIVGDPFVQFTSVYGNSAIIAASEAQGGVDRAATALDRGWFFLRQLTVFGGLGLVVVALLVWFGARAVERSGAALLALGAPVAFQFATAIAGSTFAWSRYVIAAVPLGFLLAGPLVVSMHGAAPNLGRRLAAAVVVIALGVASVIVTVPTVRAGTLQTGDEAYQLSAFPSPYRSEHFATKASRWLLAERVADDIDTITRREGDVLTDTVNTFATMALTEHPRTYVVTADRDFEQINAAPADFGVHYLLVGDPKSVAYDAVTAAHPDLWKDGGGIATLVKEYRSSSSPTLRLFRVLNVRERSTTS